MQWRREQKFRSVRGRRRRSSCVTSSSEDLRCVRSSAQWSASSWWSSAATGRTVTKEEVGVLALATTLPPLLLNPRLTMIRWASWSWSWLMRIILVVNVDDGWLWWWSCCQCVDDDGDERVGDRGKDADISEDYVNQMLIMMWYCCLQDEGGKERKTFWQRLVGRRRQ